MLYSTVNDAALIGSPILSTRNHNINNIIIILDKAAEAVEEAAKDGAYLSLDDFRQRTKVSKTVIDLMAELGLFGDLPQSNQLSLFDFT